MCFIVQEDDAMCAGDNILGHGTAAVEELSMWMESLQAIKSHNCAIGYPAQSVVIEDLPAKIAMELGSKTRREKQVLQVLARFKKSEMAKVMKRSKGAVTLAQLVTNMHGDRLDPQVRKMAVEPFMEGVKVTQISQVTNNTGVQWVHLFSMPRERIV